MSNPHFKDVNSIAKMLNNASEQQKWNFWTILLDITKSKKANQLASCAYDMDFLLDTISKELHEKSATEMKTFIDNHLKEHHGRTNVTAVDATVSSGLLQATRNEDAKTGS